MALVTEKAVGKRVGGEVRDAGFELFVEKAKFPFCWVCGDDIGGLEGSGGHFQALAIDVAKDRRGDYQIENFDGEVIEEVWLLDFDIWKWFFGGPRDRPHFSGRLIVIEFEFEFDGGACGAVTRHVDLDWWRYVGGGRGGEDGAKLSGVDLFWP